MISKTKKIIITLGSCGVSIQVGALSFRLIYNYQSIGVTKLCIESNPNEELPFYRETPFDNRKTEIGTLILQGKNSALLNQKKGFEKVELDPSIDPDRLRNLEGANAGKGGSSPESFFLSQQDSPEIYRFLLDNLMIENDQSSEIEMIIFANSQGGTSSGLFPVLIDILNEIAETTGGSIRLNIWAFILLPSVSSDNDLSENQKSNGFAFLNDLYSDLSVWKKNNINSKVEIKNPNTLPMIFVYSDNTSYGIIKKTDLNSSISKQVYLLSETEAKQHFKARMIDIQQNLRGNNDRFRLSMTGIEEISVPDTEEKLYCETRLFQEVLEDYVKISENRKNEYDKYKRNLYIHENNTSHQMFDQLLSKMNRRIDLELHNYINNSPLEKMSSGTQLTNAFNSIEKKIMDDLPKLKSEIDKVQDITLKEICEKNDNEFLNNLSNSQSYLSLYFAQEVEKQLNSNCKSILDSRGRIQSAIETSLLIIKKIIREVDEVEDGFNLRYVYNKFSKKRMIKELKEEILKRARLKMALLKYETACQLNTEVLNHLKTNIVPRLELIQSELLDVIGKLKVKINQLSQNDYGYRYPCIVLLPDQSFDERYKKTIRSDSNLELPRNALLSLVKKKYSGDIKSISIESVKENLESAALTVIQQNEMKMNLSIMLKNNKNKSACFDELTRKSKPLCAYNEIISDSMQFNLCFLEGGENSAFVKEIKDSMLINKIPGEIRFADIGIGNSIFFMQAVIGAQPQSIDVLKSCEQSYKKHGVLRSRFHYQHHNSLLPNAFDLREIEAVRLYVMANILQTINISDGTIEYIRIFGEKGRFKTDVINNPAEFWSQNLIFAFETANLFIKKAREISFREIGGQVSKIQFPEHFPQIFKEGIKSLLDDLDHLSIVYKEPK